MCYTVNQLLIIFFIIFICCYTLYSQSSCDETLNERSPEFHLVASCSVSKMKIIARGNVDTLEACIKLARSKRGLALSFINFDVDPDSGSEEEKNIQDTCLVHECPEFDLFFTIQYNPNYDYYSLYADPLPNENTTCVSRLGVFQLHETKANYTDAFDICRSEGGELSNVLSEQRTTGLSQIVSEIKARGKSLRRAYVGLDDMDNEGKFITTTNKRLHCVTYRAWSPGEPRNRHLDEDCVVLDDRRSWRVVKCKLKFPFLCEITPNGPFPFKDEEDRCSGDDFK